MALTALQEKICRLIAENRKAGGERDEGDISGLPSHRLGAVAWKKTLTELYNAADVFVCPSRQDNLPNTVAESLACGVPCVGFSTGGIPDMIEHRLNGWLAKPYDAADFSRGIRQILDNSRDFSTRARAKAEAMFSPEAIVKKQMTVYEKVLMQHTLAERKERGLHDMESSNV